MGSRLNVGVGKKPRGLFSAGEQTGTVWVER